jgi:hypothetical protein
MGSREKSEYQVERKIPYVKRSSPRHRVHLPFLLLWQVSAVVNYARARTRSYLFPVDGSRPQ